MEAAPPLSIWSWLQDSLAAQCSLEWQGKPIKGASLLDSACRLAGRLADSGIAAGTRVGVLLPRGPDALCALLALWRLGATPVPLDPALPRERLRFLCEDAALTLLLCSPEPLAALHWLPCPGVGLAPISYRQALECPPPAAEALDAEAPAYLLYTSGSSGRPKGVLITQAALCQVLWKVIALLGLNGRDRFLGIAGLGFDIAYFELLVPLFLGARLTLLDQDDCRDPAAIAQALAGGVNVVQAVPSLWRLLLPLHWPAGERPRVAISTGEALPGSIATGLCAGADAVWNLYGPTECSIWCCARRLDASCLHEAPPIGRALPGYALYLQAPGKVGPQALDEGPAEGELLIGGPGLALGYEGQPALTRERFPQMEVAGASRRLYRSGDRCRWDGVDLHWLGRLDNQIKCRGQRIEPEEIEALLESHPSVRQALVGVVEHPAGTQLVAWLAWEAGQPNKTALRLNEFLARSLPAALLPDRYQFLDSLPLGTNGKKDRHALPALTRAAAPSGGKDFEEPGEAAIAALFRDILELPAVGAHDSFFDLGGNSMLAATLLLALNRQFGRDLRLKDILRSPPTVRGLRTLFGPRPTEAELALGRGGADPLQAGHAESVDL